MRAVQLFQKSKRVGVLMGGPSSEREVSLKSGKAVLEALKHAGVSAVPLEITSDNTKHNYAFIRSQHIDCAFLALHGIFGEDGQIQQILHDLGIPFTGSGVAASRLAIDKVASRKIFQIHGLSVPRYSVVNRLAFSHPWQISSSMALPAVVKPATHGSSIGLSIVDEKKDLLRAARNAFVYDETILIEEYLRGREFTVGILDDVALPVVEIIPTKRFFDFEAKYQYGLTRYEVPARLEPAVTKALQRAGLAAHRLLGCSGCSRVDFILKDNVEPVVLEVNTIPGFTQTSLLPKAAKHEGIDFTQLCLRLLALAYEQAERK
ncbi:MAG: D-alanine--D-alanine ligase [Candidatus Omnitrophica bacterium]|nr:D-alanine--D-alanine ligase [Candidatus Omnitrophota bacterium]